MILRRIAVIVAAIALNTWAGVTCGASFFSVDASSDELVLIDGETGHVSVIGSLGFDVVDVDLARIGNRLYALNSNYSVRTDLHEINPMTGASMSSVQVHTGSGPIMLAAEGLAHVGGQLNIGYSTGGGTFPQYSNAIGSLGLDGAISGTQTGNPNFDFDGLGDDPLSGTLYGSDRDPVSGVNFFAVNQSPLSTTVFKTISPTYLINDVAFSQNALYASDDAHDELHRIDLATNDFTSLSLDRNGAYFGLASAAGSVWTYFGIDPGAGPGGAHPNSDGARDRFLSQLVPGSAGTEDFEGVALGAFPGGTRSLDFPPSAVTGTIHDLVNGATANDAEIRGTPQPSHWFPISGTRYFFTEANEGTPYFDLTFDSPVSAIGFYGASLSDYAEVPGGPFRSLQVSLDGGPPIDVVEVDPATVTDGSVHYFGLVSDMPFTRVRLFNPLQDDTFPFALTDGIALDDVTIGQADTDDFVLNVEYKMPEVMGPLIDGFDPIPPMIKATFTLDDVVAGQTMIELDQVLDFDLEIPGDNPTASDLDNFRLALDSSGRPTSLTWGAHGLDPAIIIANNNFTLEITGTDPDTEEAFRYFWSESTNTFASSSATIGDYNRNGAVGPEDYAVWKSNFGTTNSAADGNGDGVVNAADYTVWRDHFSAGAGSGSGAFAQTSVPEPSAAFLVLAGLICGLNKSRSVRRIS